MPAFAPDRGGGLPPPGRRERRRGTQTGDAPPQIAPWQCLNFLPDPQGQGSFREGLPQLAGSASSNP